MAASEIVAGFRANVQLSIANPDARRIANRPMMRSSLN